VRYLLSFCQGEEIIYEREIYICHEIAGFCVEPFGVMFVRGIRKKRAGCLSNWQWHLDDVFVKINSERFYLFGVVDHEGEVLENFAPKWAIK
jgi:putative transposase